MLLLKGVSNDPYFNLACEEFLLHEKAEDFFMLWQNHPSIIIGKHQNALAEVNIPYVMGQHIPVVRRISGGGTVFHDMGNLNFTFILNAPDREKMINFRKYSAPILDALIAMGAPAEFSPRNDIFIEGKKVSGNAEHLDQKRKRVLHHGTLLFDSHISVLNEAIRTDPERYQDMAVNSVRSQVTNIKPHIKEDLNLEEFRDKIFEQVRQHHHVTEWYHLSDSDIREIQELAAQKYQLESWNFGYSPKYTVDRIIQTRDGEFAVHMEVESGLITKIESEYPGIQSFMGQPHLPKKIWQILKDMNPKEAEALYLQFF